jgi:hypothetical protein
MVKQLAVWDNFPSRASASYFLRKYLIFLNLYCYYHNFNLLLAVCYSKITDD